MTDGSKNTAASDRSGGVGIGTIIGGAAGLIALIFILQNTGTGTVQFLAWELSLPTWVWALGLYLLGGFSGYFFAWQRRRRRRKERRD